MRDEKRKEVPKQISKLNRAVEILAKLDFTDLAHVQNVIYRIRWDLAEVNLELSELLLEEDRDNSLVQTVFPLA